MRNAARKIRRKKSKSKKSRSGSFVTAKTIVKKKQIQPTKKNKGLFIAKKEKPKKKEKVKKPVTQEQFYGEFKVIKTPSKPSEDKAFQQTLKHIENTKNIQKVHPKPSDKLTEVKEASILPKAEQDKKNAQEIHLSRMEDTSKKVKQKKFTPQTFKNLLKDSLKELKESLPTDKDGVKKFKDEAPLNDIKKNVSKNVSTEKDNIAKPLAKDAKGEQLPKSNVATETAKPLTKEKTGKQPKPINQKASVPKAKHKTEISMEKESQSINNYMEENAVTDAQLAKSNEPKFLEALDSKTEAQTEAKKAPKTYRNIENKTLVAARNKAGIHGNKELHGMFAAKLGSFGSVEKKQGTTEKKDISEQQRVNLLFEKKYNTTKKEVVEKLDKITTKVDEFFKDGKEVDKAKKLFEYRVEKKLDDVYGYTGGFREYIGISDFSKEVAEVFETEKAIFIKILDKIFDKIAVIISDGLNAAMTIIENGKKENKKLYDGLSKKEKELAKDAFEDFTDRYTDLEDTVASKEEQLASNLAEKYKENVDSLQESFDAIKEKVSATWIASAFNFINGVIETIKKLRQLVSDLLVEIKAFLPIIMDDPIGFAANLFKGIGQGIDAFKANIQQHLFGGFIQWLTGAMGPMGITIPKDIFSLKGIFNLVMQVLGLSWDYMRKKAVKLLGEPVVKAMEFGLEMFKIIKDKGIDGIWEYIKDKFADLKETVIEAIKEMLITQVLEAGIKWMIGLLIPGAGFIKAIMAIKDIIVFFVESALMLIPALIESIRAMASGSVAGVAKAIEKGLGLLVPLVINLFAKLIGLGGLAKKVQKIIKRIRKRIDKAINKLIKKARKAFKGLVKKGKAKVKGAISKLIGWLKFKKTFKSKDGGSHKLFIKKKGKKKVFYVASDPTPVEKFLIKKEKKEKDTKIKLNISEALNYHKKDIYRDKKDIIKKEDIYRNADASTKRKKRYEYDKATKKLRKTMQIFANMLSELHFGNENDVTIRTKITHKEIDGRAKNVKAWPLTYLPGKHIGSKPKDKPKGWEDYAQDATDQWVRGHLLSEQLHGPGVKWNLTPISQSVNSQMEGIERVMKVKIKEQGKYYYYITDVTYDNGRTGKDKDIPTRITISSGELKRKEGTTDKFTPKEKSPAIPISVGLPNLGGPPNLNVVGRTTLIRKGITSRLAIDIVRCRDNYIETHGGFTDLTDLMNKMNDYYGEKLTSKKDKNTERALKKITSNQENDLRKLIVIDRKISIK